ncbi:MAG: hypothetical protein POG74_07180 [Acidocella sp.]|nr:hypothetical protein [Acidocella sp.]
MAIRCPRFNFKWYFLLRTGSQLNDRELQFAGEHKMSLIVIIVVLLLIFGGGGGYYANRTYGGRGLGGVLGLILIILVVVWLVGGLGAYH